MTANLTAEVKYDGVSRGLIPRGALSILVSAKVLSGTSDETGILRVRRSSFAAGAPLTITTGKEVRR